MKSWKEFSLEEPELANYGKLMLLQTQGRVGLGFLATLRKDGAPRLHPVSLVFSSDHQFMFIPPKSPKCGDLRRDGRYALQAFTQPEKEYGTEFYISGVAQSIEDSATRQDIISQTGIHVEEQEQLFELFLDRAMFTTLAHRGKPGEHSSHLVWHASPRVRI
jgi:hypothetical protein